MRWLYLLLLVVGCYSPSYRDCEVTCASGQCPAGLNCENNTVCRLPGMSGMPCGIVTIDDAPTDEASRDIPLEQLAEAQLAALCGYYLRCGATEAVTTCVEVFKSFPFGLSGVNNNANAIAAVAAGKTVYHPDKALECLDAFESYSCDRATGAFTTPLACSQIFSGTLDANAACAIAETCISQNCMTTSCQPNACCTGTCVGNTPPGLKQLNQPCTFRDRCVGGYCDSSTPNFMCVPFKTQGQMCTSARDCAQGLTCRSTGTMLTCEVPVENLGSCVSTQDCRLFSNVCSAGTCTVGGLDGFQCPGGNECQLFHSCLNSACRLPPALGEPCSGNQQCRTGYCSTTQCVPKLTNGMNCDPVRNGGDCESAYCDTAGQCATRQVCF